MLNSWDIVFAVLLLAAAALGWRAKSLRLLGLGFAFAVAPLAATAWQHPLGQLLVSKLGGEGLRPKEDLAAWWLILVATALALIWLFNALSGMLAALKLAFLDGLAGAFLTSVIFLALLSLNMALIGSKLDDAGKVKFSQSWTFGHLRADQEPEWLKKVGATLKEVELPKPAEAVKTTKTKLKKKLAHR